MSQAEDAHETLCRRCGQSCHFAVPVNGLPVVVDDLHCRFLKQDGNSYFTCEVYTHRFEAAPWCQTVEDALEEGLLAQDCPYAQGKAGYRGKTRLRASMMAKIEPQIRQQILAEGVPIGISLDGLARFLERTGGGAWEFEIYDNGERLRIKPAR